MVVEVRMELRVRVRLDYVDFNQDVCCAIWEAFTMLCVVGYGGLYRGVFLHSSKYYFDVSLQDLTPMTLSDDKHPGALHDIWVNVRAHQRASIEEIFVISGQCPRLSGSKHLGCPPWAASRTIRV
jgi:hypothetical protein